MSYAILGNHQQFTFEDFTLFPIQEHEMEKIRQWRNAQLPVLRQDKPITEEEQKLYWKNSVEPTFSSDQPEMILFSLYQNGRHIGYGGLVHIDWKKGEAEVSFLLDPEYRCHLKQMFVLYLNQIKVIAFKYLKLQILRTETYAIRPEVILAIESVGFTLKKRLKSHVMINGKYHDSLIHTFVKKEL